MASTILSKICSACKQTKPISLFGKSPLYRDGHRGQCTPCRVAYNRGKYKYNPNRKTDPAARRRYKLKGRYGITKERYEEMLASQGGGCAVCKSNTVGGRWETFHVDHCHKTGSVRGLLCYGCNLAIGALGDNEAGLEMALAYLRKHKIRCAIAS